MKKLIIPTLAIFAVMTINLFAADSTFVGYQYLSPKPGAIQVTRFTTIILRFNQVSPFDVKNLDTFITLLSQNGDTLSGSTKIASDDKTIIFEPQEPLTPNDSVTVKLSPMLQTAEFDSLFFHSYHFFVSPLEAGMMSQMTAAMQKSPQKDLAINFYSPSQKPTSKASVASICSNGVSVPGDFPYINITINNNPDSGYIFCNNWDDAHPFNVIFDNNGDPVWYMRTPDRRRDFKVQKNGIMTMLVRGGYPFGQGYIGFDETYTEVDSFYAKHGYSTDEHELQVLKDGSYLLVAIRYLYVDMSQFVEGGQKNAIMMESCLQEFTPEGDMILQCRAWDFIDPADTYTPGENDLKGNYIRFPHMNAIDIDDDGNILISSRHASEITKIHRQTGEVIWRLGGNKNQFAYINDPLNGPENQHDIRALGNGHYTIFDNGNEHKPQVSRAVEYELDVDNKTATLVWEFRDTPDKYAHYMGNAQRLPNGNTLINWAEPNLPKLTEVRPNGEKTFEMNWENRYATYRVFRFPWQGKAKSPNLILEAQLDGITLLFNKFGDPDVAYYKIYGGPEPNSTTVLDTSKVTMKILTNLQNGQFYFFRVTAVNKSGDESEFSNQEVIKVNSTEPGKNMVINGDFAENLDYWGFYSQVPNGASCTVQDSACYVNIADGGPNIYYIQFVQPYIGLVKGENYLFEFDAWAEENRNITVWVCKSQDPYTNYGRTSLVPLQTRKKHYAYPFTMKNPSDLTALIVFFFGGSNSDVYLDNVSLVRTVESTVEEKQRMTPLHYKITGNYPNPFNGETTVTFSVEEQCRVRIELYNTLGQFEKEICSGLFAKGFHSVNLDGSDLSTGVHFCRIYATDINNMNTYTDIHKLVIVK